MTKAGFLRILIYVEDADLTPEDDGEAAKSGSGDDAAARGGGRKYERSEIAFPYGSLKDAEEIAHSLHSKWGDDAEVVQLAGGMSTTTGSGTFRSKLGTARTFGVLEGTRGRAKLTNLGKRIVDPATMPAARVEAFLNVPLFQALYEKHKSGVVPPDRALENEILELGVSSRQVGRARQSFQRSAEQAGFFAHGRDRLIIPNVGKLHEGTPKDGSALTDEEDMLDLLDRSGFPPQTMALLKMLFSQDAADWSDEKIAELVRAARTVQSLFKP